MIRYKVQVPCSCCGKIVEKEIDITCDLKCSSLLYQKKKKKQEEVKVEILQMVNSSAPVQPETLPESSKIMEIKKEETPTNDPNVCIHGYRYGACPERCAKDIFLG